MPVIAPRPSSPQSRKTFFVTAITLLAFCVCLMGVVLFLPDILQIFKPRITQKYDDRYVTDGKYVYYLDRRYKKVSGANPATFRSLYDKNAKGRNAIRGSTGYIAGRDDTAVFAGETRIDGLNPETTRIFMGWYLTDGTAVYYHDKPIENADPAAFEHIIGRYARDGKRLYYEASVIEGADLASLNYITEKPLKGGPGVATDLVGNFRAVDSSRKDANYLKDATHVYFKGIAVPGADPATFRVLYVEGDQWSLTYAADKTGYYFKGKPLPETAEKTGEPVPRGSLKLLQADRNFGWAELFYAGPSVYAFNTQEEKLEPVFTRNTSAPFRRITRGVHADDSTVYFTARVDHFRRRTKHGRALVGRYTYLQPLHGVLPENFTRTAVVKGPPSRREGEIFEADGVRYFHPRFLDGGAALAIVESDGIPLPKNFPRHALGLSTHDGMEEPPTLKALPLEKKFAHYVKFRPSFLPSTWWMLAIIAVSALLIFALLGYLKRLQRKKRDGFPSPFSEKHTHNRDLF